jgi:nucleotide-binding universal stress UspA family protein
MYKHILIAIDGSPIGAEALAHGIALARVVKARVTIVNVTERWSALDMAIESRKSRNPVQQFEALASDFAKKILADAVKKAEAAGLTARSVHVPDRHPGEGIVMTAKRVRCDLIVMGSHGRRGIKRVLLGSQAYEVLANSKTPILVVR